MLAAKFKFLIKSPWGKNLLFTSKNKNISSPELVIVEMAPPCLEIIVIIILHLAVSISSSPIADVISRIQRDKFPGLACDIVLMKSSLFVVEDIRQPTIAASGMWSKFIIHIFI